MNTKTKVGICSAVAALLGWLATASPVVCGALPAQYQAACFLGGKVADEGSKQILKHTPVQKENGGW